MIVDYAARCPPRNKRNYEKKVKFEHCLKIACPRGLRGLGVSVVVGYVTSGHDHDYADINDKF